MPGPKRASKASRVRRAPSKSKTVARKSPMRSARFKPRTGREKLDLVKLHPQCFTAPRAPQTMHFGPLPYLTLAGRGAPESPAFQRAIQALYGVAYTLKFARKALGEDFKVCPLQAQWFVDEYAAAEAGTAGAAADPLSALVAAPRETWRWKLLMLVPDFINADEVRATGAALAAKKDLPEARAVALESFNEGVCVQILHVGPYATEPDSYAKLLALMQLERTRPRGPHHEIYLSDPRRTAPEKLRTILRQPVAPA